MKNESSYFMKRFSTKIAIIFGLLLTIFPLFANAEGLITRIAAGAVSNFILAGSFIINYTFGLFFTLASLFVQFALFLNSQILNLEQNAALESGWNIVRDLANLGFVILIVVIAIATILRYKTYSYQRILPKLIGAAIIVNFSLAIAGAFINFADTFTNYFLAGISPGGWEDTTELTRKIVGAFAVQKFSVPTIEPSPFDGEIGADLGEEDGIITRQSLINIVSLSFATLFYGLATFTLLVFAFMLFARYLHLTFLLILAPIIWLFWVFPKLENLFSKWWQSFIKWTFFAPAATFFVWLSIKTAEKMAGRGTVDAHQYFAGGFLATFASQGMQMVVLCGLMLGGIVVAEKMGISGASKAMGMVKDAGNKTKKWATKTGIGTAGAAGRKALTVGKDEKGTTWAERMASGKLARIPLVGRGLTGLAKTAVKAKTIEQGKIEARAKKYENMSPDATLAAARRAAHEGVATTGNIAVMEANAKNGNFGKLNSKEQARGIGMLQAGGRGKAIVSSNPDLAPHFDKPRKGGKGEKDEDPKAFEQRVIGEATRTASTENILKALKRLEKTGDKDALKAAEYIVSGLTNGQISDIGNKGTTAQKQMIYNNLKESVKEKEVISTVLKSEKIIETKTKEADHAYKSGDAEGAKKALTDLENLRREHKKSLEGLDENDKKVLNRIQHINKLPNFQDVTKEKEVGQKDGIREGIKSVVKETEVSEKDKSSVENLLKKYGK